MNFSAGRMGLIVQVFKIMRAPRSVDIDITNNCNLRCKYCSHFSGPGDVKKDLQTEEWFSFFKELSSLNVMDVVLAGGEPFLRDDLKQLLNSVVENRMRYSILTNGTLITDDMARFIYETNRCNGVQVSIDGAGPETHDVFRGEGCFEKAILGIKCLKQHHVPVDVRVTIHKYNVNELEKIAELLLVDLCLDGFSTNAASFLGLCRQNEENIQLSVEDRTTAMEKLLNLNNRYDDRISASAGPLAEARLWDEMEQARVENRDSLPHGGFLTACGCVNVRIGVRADGVIVPCPMLSHIELGRIGKDSLKDIWQNHPKMIEMRQRAQIPLNDFDFCKDCDYIPYCTGNCPGLSYNRTGNEQQPSSDECLRRFLDEGGKLPGNGCEM